MKRLNLTKTIRFEVFKRDKFTCHYCGRKAPDVVLHIDHIEPVSKGGTNDIINLITSCYECNLGKSDRKLSDNSVIEKQRKQLELLQERREQIELMFKWKKSLSRLDDETIEMVKEYADAKIQPFSINDNGKTNISNLLRRYGVNELLDAIDLSATTYLKFSKEGELSQSSVENFLDKLGGILFNRRLKPIDQKLAFIKNKARNAFNYYDDRRGAIMLNQYVVALRKCWHYTDNDILRDLDSELIPKLENTTNWSEWGALLEGRIKTITKPEKPSAMTDYTYKIPKDRTQEEMVNLFQGRKYATDEALLVLNHLLTPYPQYNKKEFQKALYEALIIFIKKQEEFKNTEFEEYIENKNELHSLIIDSSFNGKSMRYFIDYDIETVGDDKLSLLVGLDNLVYRVIDELFMDDFLFRPADYSINDLSTTRQLAIECLESWRGM